MKEPTQMDDLPEWARNALRAASTPPAAPSVRQQRERPAWPLFVDAALVGSFLPRELVPQVLSGEDRKAAESEVLRFCEVTHQPEGVRWSLTRQARQDVLASSDPTEISSAADRIAQRFTDPLAVALRECLQGARRRELSALSGPELEATRLAVTWLRGLERLELPALEDLDRQLALRRLLESFERMTGMVGTQEQRSDRFFGRGEEMEDLRAYVGVVAADSFTGAVRRAAKTVQRIFTGRQPKVVWGTGGVGKTTLIAKFMLEHAQAAQSRFPFAYLDFDRSTITARNRPGLLAEICDQVGAQFEELTQAMSALRQRVLSLSRNIDLNSETDTISLLLPHAAEFRDWIDRTFSSSTPFLLVFDTFEVVQYGPDQVVGLEEFVAAFTRGDADDWSRLRLIIAGRQRVSRFLGSVEELELGALDRAGSAEMLAALAADAGKPISIEDATRLVQAVSKHVRDRSNTGIRPLRLKLIGELFKEGGETGQSIVKTLLDDLAKPMTDQSIVGRTFVDGILVRRILGHVKDRRVHALADPGLVVRRITPDVIRDVMTRGTPKPGDSEAPAPDRDEAEPPWIIDDAEAADIFDAFAREVSLVDPEGDALRHRQDVRQEMLPLIRAHRPRGFLLLHRLAFDHFRAQTVADPSDTASAAEAIYHALWLQKPCEEIEESWPEGKAFDPRIDPEEFDGGSMENIYLRAKKGAALDPDEIVRLPRDVAVEWLGSRSSELLAQQRLDSVVAEVRAVGGSSYRALDSRPDVAAVVARVLYRAGLWSEAASLLERHLGQIVLSGRQRDRSLLRTWATILAKSGAEPGHLAMLLPLAERIDDPFVRTEVLAHICLGLDDALGRANIRGRAREAVASSVPLVRPTQWRREQRILRLALATRYYGSHRLAEIYLAQSERVAHDPAVWGILSQWRGKPVDQNNVERIWMSERTKFITADTTKDVCALAGADHSDWIVPFGNALTRDFDRHRKAVKKATRGIAPIAVAPHVDRAVDMRDGNALFELVAERGMLRIAYEIGASEARGLIIPTTAQQMARALLRWHRITTGEDVLPAMWETRAVADLAAEAKWDDLVPRLLVYALQRIQNQWPHGLGTPPDAEDLIGEAIKTTLQSADKAAADGASLFLIIVREIDRLLEEGIRLAGDEDAALARLIEGVDWAIMVRRLLVYAQARLARHGRSPQMHTFDASDYVQQAIRFLLDGSRRYDGSKSLFLFLGGVVDSLISHDAERGWRRGPHHPIGDDVRSDEISEGFLPAGDDFSADIIARDALERFIDTLEPDLAYYVRMRAEWQNATAEELASLMGVKVEEIRNMDKRLRRRRDKWPRG